MNEVGVSFTVSSGILKGFLYTFRLQAKNIYGWGAYSTTTDFAAAGVPYKMDPPVTAVDPSDGLKILTTWVAPYDNSDAISAYKIRFLAFDGVFYETSECSGVGAPVSCSVAMTTFRAAPFNLVLNSLLKSVVSATNTNGYGDESEANFAGALIQTVPTQMASPTRNILTTSSLLAVDWQALTSTTDTGNSPINSYNLQWDKGSNEATWYDLLGAEGNY